MRRGPSLKRKAEADPLFNSILVSQLTNQVLLDGKKDTARNIVYKALELVEKQKTKVTGFIIGSGKLYSVTLNGYLIISSATTGKVETFKKIGSPVTSSPIIADGKMFILSEDSKLFGFN